MTVAENFDELMDMMKEHEYEGASKLTPIEYGRMRGIKPQLIYYHLRTHNDSSKEKYIQIERCLCGKPVLDVKLADQYFGKGEFDPNYVEQEEDD